MVVTLCVGMLSACGQQQQASSASTASASSEAATADSASAASGSSEAAATSSAAAEASSAAAQEAAASAAAGEADIAETFPSWNADSASLAKPVAFVQEATDESSPNYVEPEKRLATFDVDGTLICEKAPVYFAPTITTSHSSRFLR